MTGVAYKLKYVQKFKKTSKIVDVMEMMVTTTTMCDWPCTNQPLQRPWNGWKRPINLFPTFSQDDDLRNWAIIQLTRNRNWQKLQTHPWHKLLGPRFEIAGWKPQGLAPSGGKGQALNPGMSCPPWPKCFV